FLSAATPKVLVPQGVASLGHRVVTVCLLRSVRGRCRPKALNASHVLRRYGAGAAATGGGHTAAVPACPAARSPTSAHGAATSGAWSEASQAVVVGETAPARAARATARPRPFSASSRWGARGARGGPQTGGAPPLSRARNGSYGSRQKARDRMAVILRAARLAVLLLIAACGVDMGYMKPGATQAQFYQELAVCEHFTEYGGFTAGGGAPPGAPRAHTLHTPPRAAPPRP